MRNRIVAASAPYTTAQQRPPPARAFGSALLGVVCFPKTGPCVMRVSGAPCRAKRRGRDSNPRWSYPQTAFQLLHLRPLGTLPKPEPLQLHSTRTPVRRPPRLLWDLGGRRP